MTIFDFQADTKHPIFPVRRDTRQAENAEHRNASIIFTSIFFSAKNTLSKNTIPEISLLENALWGIFVWKRVRGGGQKALGILMPR